MKDEKNTGFERARIEHCRCGGTLVRNNVYFRKGAPVRVYVQCGECGKFVSRYTLKGYTSDEPYESLLQRLRFTKFTSGKRALRIVEEFTGKIGDEYDHALELIRTQEDARRMEEIIEEDFPESLEE